MARRRRNRTPRKRSSRLLIVTQVLLLVGALVVILFFRDFIADGAGEMLGSFGASDVQVEKSIDRSSGADAPGEDASSANPAPKPDVEASE